MTCTWCLLSVEDEITMEYFLLCKFFHSTFSRLIYIYTIIGKTCQHVVICEHIRLVYFGIASDSGVRYKNKVNIYILGRLVSMPSWPSTFNWSISVYFLRAGYVSGTRWRRFLFSAFQRAVGEAVTDEECYCTYQQDGLTRVTVEGQIMHNTYFLETAFREGILSNG